MIGQRIRGLTFNGPQETVTLVMRWLAWIQKIALAKVARKSDTYSLTWKRVRSFVADVTVLAEFQSLQLLLLIRKLDPLHAQEELKPVRATSMVQVLLSVLILRLNVP